MHASNTKDGRPRRNWQPLLLGAGVLALAHYAALLFRVQPAVSLWFPPSGVAVALALWFGPPAAIVTAMVSTLVAPIWGNHGWTQWVGLTDAVEPLIAWLFYRWLWQRSLSFDRVKDISAFILSAPVFACASSAVTGSVVLALVGNMPWSAVPHAIPHWWLGNAIGTMAIAPMAILTLTPILQRWGWLPNAPVSPSTSTFEHHNLPRLRAEKIVIFVLSLAIASLSVSQTSRTGFAFQQFAFLNFIPIFWAALRFGALGSTATASLCVIAALLNYVLKYPDALTLQNFPVDSGVLTVHKLSLMIQCVVGLFIGTAITQQTQAQIKLVISQVKLAEYEVKLQLNEKLEASNQALSESNLQLEQANRDKDELLLREQTARSQAEAANRIKDEFLAVVSHELRSPLNPILGWSKLLQSGRLDNATTQLALETIDRNAKLQSQLVEDLLDVSRILRGKLVLHKVKLDLARVVRAAIEMVRLSAEAKAIALTLTLPDSNSSLLVFGDPNRLQQIVVNLLTNAVKFTPEGGQINIALSQVTQLNSRSYAQVQVTDTGKGIHPDFLPYVFDRFQQEDIGTTRKFGGLGLGLAIVRHLVQLHEGEVEAQSEGLNRGATFRVRLPLVAVEALPCEIASDPPALTHCLTGKRILILDDDGDTRDLLQYALEAEQAGVTLTASAQEAIAQLNATLPDLIISDISMPDMDGYSFIRHVRRVQPHRIPAIALTANVREEDRVQAIVAGFDTHLAKPVTLETLLVEIERLINSRKHP